MNTKSSKFKFVCYGLVGLFVLAIYALVTCVHMDAVHAFYNEAQNTYDARSEEGYRRCDVCGKYGYAVDVHKMRDPYLGPDSKYVCQTCRYGIIERRAQERAKDAVNQGENR